jgi:hypothetical protein
MPAFHALVPGCSGDGRFGGAGRDGVREGVGLALRVGDELGVAEDDAGEVGVRDTDVEGVGLGEVGVTVGLAEGESLASGDGCAGELSVAAAVGGLAATAAALVANTDRAARNTAICGGSCGASG